MTKYAAAFALYWHYLLDVILTHIFVIAFFRMGYVSIAAILMSTDAVITVTLSVFISRCVATLHPSVRGRVSALLRFVLAGVWFLAIMWLSEGVDSTLSLVLFVPYVIFKLLFMVNSSLCADFNFSLKDKFNIDLAQIAAVQNILLRGGTAMAPAVALVMLSSAAVNSAIFIAVIVASVFSILFLKHVYFSPIDRKSSVQDGFIPFRKLLENPLMRWGFLNVLLGNIAFGGVAFLLLSNLKASSHYFLNEITILYAAFFVVQSAVLVFGERIVPVTRFSHLGILSVLCGLFVFVVGANPGKAAELFACLGVGVTYSLTISGMQKVITSKLRGSGFIEYAAWVQLAGRSSYFAMVSLFGLLLSVGYTSSVLLMLCGLIGIIVGMLFMTVKGSSVLVEQESAAI